MAIHECLGPSFHPFRASLNLEESIARNGPTTRSVLHPYVTLALERYCNPAQNPAAPYLYNNRSVSNADQKPKRKKKKRPGPRERRAAAKGDCSNKLKLLELNKVISYLLQVANIYYYPSVAQHKAEQIGNLRMYYEGTQMQAMRSAPAFLHNTPQVTSS